MSSVFSHESAQRNDAGHLIDKNVFKTTRSFCYQWFMLDNMNGLLGELNLLYSYELILH